jgi:hypothetical protein
MPKIRHERADVRARAEREHRELDALARRLRPEDWELLAPRPAGKELWTVKDAFAHVVYWKLHSARVIRGVRAPESLRGLTANQLNVRVYEDWKDEPVDVLLEWHLWVQCQVLDAIDSRDEAWFGRRPRSPWWPSDFESHSAEHRLDDIEAALKRVERAGLVTA